MGVLEEGKGGEKERGKEEKEVGYLRVIRHELVLLHCVVVIQLPGQTHTEATVSVELACFAALIADVHHTNSHFGITLNSLLI